VIGSAMQILVPHWKLVYSFLFSSCLSANDPISVVPIMHTAGASHSLMILVLGESLLTEGFATVGFHLFGERIMECDSTYSTWNIIQLLIKDFFFSPLVGIIIGLLTCLCMNLVNQPYRDLDTIIQITLQIFCAYFSFYLAEYEYEVSGVFSVVGAGIVFVTFAKKSVLRYNLVDSIWQSLEWLASTLMFLFAGVVMVYTAFHRVDWKYDLFVIITLYFLLTITRIGSVFLVYPLFALLGNDPYHPSVYGHNEMKFLSLTGIKGAISVILLLGVIEYESVGYISRDDMEEFLVYGCGLIALNQLFTGTWTYYTLRYFSLLPMESNEEKMIMRFMRNKIRYELYEMNELSTNNLNYSVINLSIFKTLQAVDLFANEREETKQLSADILYLTSAMPSLASSPSSPLAFSQGRRSYNHELYRVLKVKYLESIYSLYLHDISIGRLQRNSYPTQRLLNSIDYIRNDHHVTKLSDWDLIQQSIQMNPYVFWALEKLIDPLFLLFTSQKPSQYYLNLTDKWRVYILTSYISAHRRTMNRMEHYLSLQISSNRETTSGEEKARQTMSQDIPELQTLLQQSQELVRVFILFSFPKLNNLPFCRFN
jgi:NhaP-type Na+/H+ or K+/H+ antiporter